MSAEECPLKNLSDEELAFKAGKEKNAAAFDALHKRYRNAILNYIHRMAGNMAAAEDITQEVFLSVYEKLEAFETKPKFSSWLYRIATNKAIDLIRKKGRQQGTESLDEAVSDKGSEISLIDMLPDNKDRPDLVLRRKEFEEKIQLAIDSLPERLKTVFILCYLQGRSHEEVAQILSCRVTSVGVWLMRAREKFMKKLDLKSLLTKS